MGGRVWTQFTRDWMEARCEDEQANQESCDLCLVMSTKWFTLLAKNEKYETKQDYLRHHVSYVMISLVPKSRYLLNSFLVRTQHRTKTRTEIRKGQKFLGGLSDFLNERNQYARALSLNWHHPLSRAMLNQYCMHSSCPCMRVIRRLIYHDKCSQINRWPPTVVVACIFSADNANYRGGNG